MPYKDRETRNKRRKEGGNYNAYIKRYYKNNPDYARKAVLRKFNLSLEAYSVLFDSQNGVCAVCEKPEKVIIKKGFGLRSLSVDHNHINGKIRGLLCSTCNRALGLLYDDEIIIQNLLTYLRKHKN